MLSNMNQVWFWLRAAAVSRRSDSDLPRSLPTSFTQVWHESPGRSDNIFHFKKMHPAFACSEMHIHGQTVTTLSKWQIIWTQQKAEQKKHLAAMAWQTHRTPGAPHRSPLPPASPLLNCKGSLGLPVHNISEYQFKS